MFKCRGKIQKGYKSCAKSKPERASWILRLKTGAREPPSVPAQKCSSTSSSACFSRPHCNDGCSPSLGETHLSVVTKADSELWYLGTQRCVSPVPFRSPPALFRNRKTEFKRESNVPESKQGEKSEKTDGTRTQDDLSRSPWAFSLYWATSSTLVGFSNWSTIDQEKKRLKGSGVGILLSEQLFVSTNYWISCMCYPL